MIRNIQNNQFKKFKKVVILDSVIFYPEHRQILGKIAEIVEEYPSSIPETLEKQYDENPELFKNMKCYTQIAADNIPLQLLMNRIEGADAIISCWTNIPDKILELNQQLKLVVFWTHEMEHRINIKLAEKMGITVCNIPDYGTDSVAEVVFAGLFILLKKNFSKTAENNEEMALEVMHKIFQKFRLLEKNEKETRKGQFLHHFHKLGMIKFNITKENLDQVIPEKLVENKTMGIIGKNQSFDCLEKIAKKSFRMNVNRFIITDSNLAEYYKFITENEVIVFDSNEIKNPELEKIKLLLENKLIDIKDTNKLAYALKNKKFGILGLGRIGIKVAKIAKELGVKLVYYSKTRKPSLEKELQMNYLELEELLKTSDIISIHLPAHKADGLLSKEKLKLMKQGTIFINTSDGNIIDQKFLTKLMLEKKIFAFLDVYPGLPRKDILGIEMEDQKDWKIREHLKEHVMTYRAGWKTQESVRVKTYKLLGQMIDYLLEQKNEK